MNLSMRWLDEFVHVDTPIHDFCEALTMSGSKVEGYEVEGTEIENVVVGKVLAMERHPNSDHMWICQVDVGKSEPVQIVTGAQNVHVGDLVPAALHKSHLPGGVTITKGKLRGVESNGMLCSLKELGLTTHDFPYAIEDGIFILQEVCAVGEDIRTAIGLNDTVVEFEITSNRPDCLSIIGLARETAATYRLPLHLHTPVVQGAGGDVNSLLKVRVENTELCQRYMAAVVRNIKVASSPRWLRERLRACGVRPINNIVDITNYVMLEYGQPMHAFDYKCLDGSAITVRRAAEGEKFRSLDDKDHVLDAKTLVIADDKKAVALAGIMGGANSEITDGTATVVFESANFLGASVRVSAKKQGMRTESSARFEKGLDPENTLAAIDRACELVEMLGAGDVVDGTIDLYPGKKPLREVTFNAAKINAFLGTSVPEDYMRSVLSRLGFVLAGERVTIPSWRDDVLGTADLAEEVIRMYGYNTIESTLMCARTTEGKRTPKQKFELELEHALTGMGLSEIETFSFISPKYYDKICRPADDPLRRSVVIRNPLGEDTSVMRTTALPSMLEVLARNNNFNNENLRLYEMATVYLPKDDPNELPDEPTSLTLGMYGGCDFYTIKGVCESLYKLVGADVKFVARTDDPTFHPGRCAAMYAGSDLVGVIGQIHPTVAANYGFTFPVYTAEIRVPVLMAHKSGEIQYRPLPKYPAVTRDLSFVCDEDIEVGTIEDTIRKAVGKLVENIRLFDIYRGAQVGAGRKSVSMRVTLRAADRTLTQEETEKDTAKIIDALERDLGIKLRN